MKNEKLPQFQPHFLAPKYWLFWLGVAIWRSILCLPYPILRYIGHGLGSLFSHLKVGKRRAAIARRILNFVSLICLKTTVKRFCKKISAQ